MFTKAMSSAKQGKENFSLCLHIRKILIVLFHRANAREPVEPKAPLAALRTQTQQAKFKQTKFKQSKFIYSRGGVSMPGFQDIIGHENIKEHLQRAIESNHVSHAYILTGEAGMGRKSIANAFAMTLLCEKGKSEPCMECHACKQVMSGNHPDLIYVTHEKTGSIGVDDVREQIHDTIMIRPYSSYYKIYIVDEAEKMTVQAQNALLKTIEEPPSYVVIMLLTTNQEVFLPTILSRCVQLKLKPLQDSVVRSFLTGSLGIAESKAEIYAAFARGNLGRAIHLASSEEFQVM